MWETSNLVSKMIGYSVLGVCVLVWGACSSDYIENEEASSWRVGENVEQEPSMMFEEQPKEMEKEPVLQPVELETCAEPFYVGPIWQQVNQAKALQESEWIVQLETTKLQLLTSAPYNEETRSYEVEDYSQEFQEIEAQLQDYQLQLIANKPYETYAPEETKDIILIVKGKPQKILEMLKNSCHIEAFDLTGFHCDCASQMCQQAESCQLAYMFNSSENHMAWPHFERSAISCQDDIYMGANHALRYVNDLRGITWTFGGSPSYVTSWNESPCQEERQLEHIKY